MGAHLDLVINYYGSEDLLRRSLFVKGAHLLFLFYAKEILTETEVGLADHPFVEVRLYAIYLHDVVVFIKYKTPSLYKLS